MSVLDVGLKFFPKNYIIDVMASIEFTTDNISTLNKCGVIINKYLESENKTQ